jgi:hypothetical protein
MSEAAYLDILAYVLRENGFPAGAADLSVDALDGVEVLPTRPKPLPAISDFSYVEVVGCLVPGSDGAWTLSSASDPVAAAAPGGPLGTAISTSTAPPIALGSQTYHLLDAMAYTPESLKGQKIYVRGLLIKLPSEQRMTISDLRSVSTTCP